jgi:acyl-CoA thioesterase-1
MIFKPFNGCRVVVCGDSISAGVVYDEQEQKYIKSKETFVCMMQNSLNCAITNVSRFGNTIATALPRLKKDMDKVKPDVVIIELGGNDCAFKWDQIAANPTFEHFPATDIGVFAQTLKQLILSLKAQGVQPVLTSLPPLDPDRYLKWVSKNSADTANHILEWLGSVSRIYWWHERYNAALLGTAESTNSPLIDLRSAFLNTVDFRKYICRDGIHPNKEGHQLICNAISEFLKIKCPTLLKPITV